MRFWFVSGDEQLRSCAERGNASGRAIRPSTGGNPTTACIPTTLLAYHGNWYLLAHHEAKDRMSAFALSRFRNIEKTGECFQRSPEFNARSFAREAFGITRGDKPMRVRRLFEPELSVYLVEREWKPSQSFKQRADGRVEMRLETSGRKELIRWELS